MLSRSDLEELRSLEEEMWRSETRGDRGWMDAHLASDFFEFGLSGRRYDRSGVLDAEVGEIDAVLPLHDFRCTSLGDSHVLATYQIECYGSRANRSSIWHRTDTSWVMDFHQGTPTEDG
ncbi:MAG TPA: DUF4440 domain-containing protein [Gemmatimonadetes bacterium]|nr:DUF4440 domain-containing protein [Gemmatimonadota bacterium]